MGTVNCKIRHQITDKKFSGTVLKYQIGSHLWKIVIGSKEQRKQAKLQWLQGPSEINYGTLNDVRR
jgi:hypothetical protein